MSNLVALPLPPPRLSPKLRRAIDQRVRKMLSVSEACEQVGLSTAGWYAAMQRPAVRGHLEEVQRRFIAEAATLKASAKTLALRKAIEMLETTKNETVKVRLIEFLAGEGKSPQVAVNVDARSAPGGYEYPGTLMQPRPETIEHQ
jgi:hypothetical protein